MNRRRKVSIILLVALVLAVPILLPPSREEVDYYHISARVTSTELAVTADDIEVQILTPVWSSGMIQRWNQEDISGALNMTVNGTYTFRLAQSKARVRFIINNETHQTNWYELINWQMVVILASGVDYSYVLEAWVEYNHSSYVWAYLSLITVENRRQSIN